MCVLSHFRSLVSGGCVRLHGMELRSILAGRSTTSDGRGLQYAHRSRRRSKRSRLRCRGDRRRRRRHGGGAVRRDPRIARAAGGTHGAAGRHHRHLRRDHLDSQHAPCRRHRRQPGESRAFPAPGGRQPFQRGTAPGIPGQRAGRRRGDRGEVRREVPRPAAAPRLCAGSRRRHAERPRAGAAALRRPQARRAFPAGPAAHSRIHHPGRDDGRSRRRGAPAGHDALDGVPAPCVASVRAPCLRPAASSARHAAGDGQRADRPAAAFDAATRGAHPGGHESRGIAAHGGCRDRRRAAPGHDDAADRGAARCDHGNGRLQPPPAATRGDAAPAYARIQPRRAWPYRRAARSGAGAGRPLRHRQSGQRVLGAGLRPQAARRQHGGVSAFRAGPRQAGDGHGQQGGPPVRQRIRHPTISLSAPCTRRTKPRRRSPLS